MEALHKLEEVQKMLSFLESRGLSSNHADSDRFLASFLLFMAQPCGVSIEMKFHLIAENLSKISAAVVKESHLLVPEDYPQVSANPPLPFTVEHGNKCCSLRSSVDDVAMVGLESMQRANSTLEDFCRSYFMFHGMDASNPQSVFRFLPVLSFTESYIYQLDRFNEGLLHLPLEHSSTDRIPHSLNDTCKMLKGSRELAKKSVELFRTDPFRPLTLLLEQLGLLTDRIKAELRDGTEYWALERKLCHALNNKTEISVEDVVRAIHLKSFDYRVLNLLLYQLRDQQVNDLHMEFLSVSEFLVEISDDLFDYEDDVVENNFNILRMFARLYGASMAPTVLAKFIAEAEAKYESLSKRLDPNLSSNYWRRCEEATREGGKSSGHALGTWNIPPVIADEDSYRKHILASEPAPFILVSKSSLFEEGKAGALLIQARDPEQNAAASEEEVEEDDFASGFVIRRQRQCHSPQSTVTFERRAVSLLLKSASLYPFESMHQPKLTSPVLVISGTVKEEEMGLFTTSLSIYLKLRSRIRKSKI
ncbi:hypothetical protein H6P81_011431 [Aristolochia fimbriata]|uniref:Uncharacterized protein n=1 Tax=Aristolochia fimbriata TaxID=158543 RepID=A0AAV7EUE8_ARIFI|nr:hypothetical protein H6P81_011431 [Aristolochia fimbriata]